MAGLPPGDPQLVSMIVSHLKTQGLFDQFRRDCLADVDTKPAYLNLKQRVDNFVSNHLSNHTWSPHLNKNQLRNNIRQLVLQSGMLEQGVDRIVAQVVDPKVNHIFRPQVERVVCEFLSPGSCSEEPPALLPSAESRPDFSFPEQASTSTPATFGASNAMSILDTITSLNQEASVRASTATERERKSQASNDLMQPMDESEQDMSTAEEDGKPPEEEEEAKLAAEVQALEVKSEDTQERVDQGKEGLMEEVKMEEEESGAQEKTEDEKGNTEEEKASKMTGKSSQEKQDEDEVKSTSQAKQKARERIKEEYSLEDSDLEGLSDITVSSVHTSDLSSFEGESEDEDQPSDSSEEGELAPDDKGERAETKDAAEGAGDEEKERKPRRKAYVHKPFLYSRYYSDSDDEITVEERRRSAAKEKEERLLKRQQNRERLEEKRKQKAMLAEEQDQPKKQKSGDSAGLESPRAKEARKEQKVLEKKMALNRKRKLDSKIEEEVTSSKKGDSGDVSKKAEVKSATSKPPQHKLMRVSSEPAHSDERNRKTSSNVSEDSSDTKKLVDKGRTHSFILELEQGSQEALKQRSVGKFDRLSRKEFHSKDRKEKERSLSDERVRLKQKQDKKSEHQVEEAQQKDGTAVKEEKGEKKSKIKSEKRMAGSSREGKVSAPEGASEDGGSKDAKKVKTASMETVKTERDKNKEKDKEKIKEREKTKAEKASVKSDIRQMPRPDSATSSEDRSDMEPGPDGGKKKNKHSKEVTKRSKSYTEDRPGDKPKSKTDAKESDKEKAKMVQESSKLNKSSSDANKDLKKVRPAEKGRSIEKSKSKSKDDTVTPKTDKKVQSPEVRSSGGASVNKPEASKEKKKEGKEQQKVSEEALHEKSDAKGAKKKQEKKEKVSEKRDDTHEEKKAPREEKMEKSDWSSKASVSSLSLETEEPPKKQPLLHDTSTDSEPITTTVTTSFSDDTCDALSDITPEPPEGEMESRIREMAGVPAEADALLTLMNVCASAEARLPPQSAQVDMTPEMALQDADMKMKEAALTLLSMDPDSTLFPSLLCEDAREESATSLPALQPMDTTTAEEEETLHPTLQPAPEIESTGPEPSGITSQQTTQLTEEKLNVSDEHGEAQTKLDTSVVATSETHPPQEKEAAPNAAYLNEEEVISAEIPPETQSEEKLIAPADQEVSETEAGSGNTEESREVVCDSTQVSEIPSNQMHTEPDFLVTNTSLETEEAAVEENQEDQAKMDTYGNEAASQTVKEEKESVLKTDLQASVHQMEASVSDKTEEIIENEPESKLVKQISNVSSTDSQEDEKSSDVSEMEEQPDRTGRRKQKLSGQEDATTQQSGEEKDEKEVEEIKDQLSQATEKEEEEKVVEVEAPHSGQSSEILEEAEKEQPDEDEKPEEAPSCRDELEAAVKDVTPDDEKKDADSADETEPLEQSEEDETTEKKADPNDGVQREGDAGLPSSAPEIGEEAESCDSKEKTDTCQAGLKRKRSEEVVESLEETDTEVEEKEGSALKQRDRQPDEGSVSPTVSQSEGHEDVKEESCSDVKTDETEEEQQDQEPAPKRPAQRGQLSTAEAMEDSDEKVKKADEKVSELNEEEDLEEEEEEEEEEDDEKEEDEEEEKETATRATTRSASRIEAERNKPSKPSTRASRQSAKDETAAGSRGTRGQAAAAKGGRKREASPPAARTRGGQKSEEPPSKRAKR
ncbi:uncharacterized protein bod1l1 isoform 2-T2 [Pholidichthys leucotaenia]